MGGQLRCESENLLNAAKESNNHQLFLFLLIRLETSMRMSNILSIQLQYVNFEKNEIFLPHTKTGEKLQPITENVAKHIQKVIKSLPHNERWLFSSIGNRKSKTGHTQDLREPFREAVRKAGLDEKKLSGTQCDTQR